MLVSKGEKKEKRTNFHVEFIYTQVPYRSQKTSSMPARSIHWELALLCAKVTTPTSFFSPVL
jgi:hypothetical protein